MRQQTKELFVLLTGSDGDCISCIMNHYLKKWNINYNYYHILRPGTRMEVWGRNTIIRY